MNHIINTPCGALRGVCTKHEGVVAYKGIRYATAKRFEYPIEVIHWDGVYDATKYGACAYQPRSFYNEEDMPKKVFYYNEFRKGESYEYSEDCLFLNVFAPKDAANKLPVIIYIHGGGFTGGCGHEKHFDVPVWPKKGVIGVTINYRLGPLGFAVLPEMKEKDGKCGNYGLYDQLTAFKWVKRNIEAFGGDPENITIMGQSAGAMSVQHHCLSPLSKDLFQKAVMSSGGGVSKMMTTPAPEKKYPLWRAVMEKTGAKTLDEFKKVPVNVLFEAWNSCKTIEMGGGCSPVIDGELIIDKGHRLVAAKKQHAIPYMMGTTSEDVVPPILYSMAKSWCAGNENSYRWFFERRLPGDDHGAWHSSDLWYWFGTLDNCWRPFTDKDKALSEEMSDRLCAFASCGKPNTGDYIEWESGSKNAFTFGDEASGHSKQSTIKLWKTMFTNEAPGE